MRKQKKKNKMIDEKLPKFNEEMRKKTNYLLLYRGEKPQKPS